MEEARLLDDVASPKQQRRWERETERLRGLQVDSEFELRRMLNRNVAGFPPLRIFATKYAARLYWALRLGL